MPDHTFLNMNIVLEKLNVDHLIFKPGFDIIKKIFSISANEDIYPISLLKFGSSVCIPALEWLRIYR